MLLVTQALFGQLSTPCVKGCSNKTLRSAVHKNVLVCQGCAEMVQSVAYNRLDWLSASVRM